MPTRISFDTRELTVFRRRLRSAVFRAEGADRDTLERVGNLVVPSPGRGPLARATPVRTGQLRDSTRKRIRSDAGRLRLVISQPARSAQGALYGVFVRLGTRRSRANPYHERVFARLRPRIRAILKGSAQRLALAIAGRR